MQLTRVISTQLDDLSRRLIKVLRFGRSDVQTPFQALPHGIDSNPVKDWLAVYSETTEKGKPVIIGYINPDQLAEVGGTRIYSTDGNGAVQFAIYLRADGTCEVGGDTDNMVRFVPVANSVNELKDSVNELKNLFTSWTPVPNDGGAALKSVVTSWASSPLVEDITGAKIDEVKTL
jgi:hypothetical protein